jgi:hypothetical protein
MHYALLQCCSKKLDQCRFVNVGMGAGGIYVADAFREPEGGIGPNRLGTLPKLVAVMDADARIGRSMQHEDRTAVGPLNGLIRIMSQ